MKTLATLHAKELYDVIRFPADTSSEHIPDPDGRGRKPVLTLHTYCGFSFFSFFGSRGFPWGYRSECDRYTCPRCGKLPCNRIVGEDPEMLTIIKNWARRKRFAVTTLDMEEVTAANVN